MLSSGYQANFNQYSHMPTPAMNHLDQALLQPPQLSSPNCPRCASTNTKFCYYNNYSLAQPRFFCKSCKRYWTRGGSLRNVPVGGGCRKTRRRSRRRSQSDTGDNNCNASTSPGSDHNTTSRADIDLAAVFARYVSPDQTTGISLPRDPSTTATTAAGTSTSSSSWSSSSSASGLQTRCEPDDGIGLTSHNNNYSPNQTHHHNHLPLLTDDQPNIEVDCFWDDMAGNTSGEGNVECPLFWSSSCQEDDPSHGLSTTSTELITTAWELEHELGLSFPPLISSAAAGGITDSNIDDVWLELDMFNAESSSLDDGFDQLPAGI